jgi:alkylation response protein AidB-like acyl-CoA dehydrogenase
MDLTFTPQQLAFRAEVRAWLQANVPKQRLPSFDTREGFEAHRAWERKLYEARLSMVIWPEDLGGRGCDLIDWLIFEEEYWRADAPLRVNQNGQLLLGPTLMEFGTAAQKKRFLPRMASSEDMWAQGWSEPNAGSDMAAITASARIDGDHFVLRGQKTWASRGAFADWLFGLFRTDPASERHKGLTFVLVPLDTPGVTVRPIAQLDGETGFAEVFFDDARVPVANQLGERDKGWGVAMATAGFERGLMLRSPARFQETACRLVQLFRANAATAPRGTREEVVRCWMDAEAYALDTYRTVSRLLAGGKIGAEASLNKIFWSELDVRMHETALRILGHRGDLQPEAPAAEGTGSWLDGWLFSLSGPIYAGTNEIQRNVIAERILGLPRSF